MQRGRNGHLRKRRLAHASVHHHIFWEATSLRLFGSLFARGEVIMSTIYPIEWHRKIHRKWLARSSRNNSVKTQGTYDVRRCPGFNATGPTGERAAMKTSDQDQQSVSHRFAVGRMVRFSTLRPRRNAAKGDYEVMAQLPAQDGEFQYRIQSNYESHQRVAREDELKAA
jgi:hypothetical protein